MRFAVATFFAGAVMAHYDGASTVYETDVETITSCAPSVTDCPAASHTSTPVAVETSISSEVPVVIESSTSSEIPAVPTPIPTLSSISYYNGTSSAYLPVGTEPSCPGSSVKTITTSITTVLPTVIYETVDVPCETSVSSYIPTGGYASSSVAVPSETPVFTGGASSMSVSIFAAAAGIVALMA